MQEFGSEKILFIGAVTSCIQAASQRSILAKPLRSLAGGRRVANPQHWNSPFSWIYFNLPICAAQKSNKKTAALSNSGLYGMHLA